VVYRRWHGGVWAVGIGRKLQETFADIVDKDLEITLESELEFMLEEEELAPEQLERMQDVDEQVQKHAERLGIHLVVDDLLESESEDGPGAEAFPRFERQLWLDMWHYIPLGVVEDFGVESRHWGPVQATVANDREFLRKMEQAAESWSWASRYIHGDEADLGSDLKFEDRDADRALDADLALYETSMLNNVVGADSDRAVLDGHLETALVWVDSIGVDCRVSVSPNRPEGAEAEALLSSRGYERAENRARYVRGPEPSDLPDPQGIKVIELFAGTMADKLARVKEIYPEKNEMFEELRDKLLRPMSEERPLTDHERRLRNFIAAYVTEEEEKFSQLLRESYDLSNKAEVFFEVLPGRDAWRCYLAVDEEGRYIGAAAMMMAEEYEQFAQLVFSAVAPEASGRGCHTALLNRQIADAADADCSVLFAEMNEPPHEGNDDSEERRELLDAGFQLLHVRHTWHPPRPEPSP
jgi:GNAT superfamily N-acetyltransferase